MKNGVNGRAASYTATPQGKEIECVSLQDATSVRITEAILSDAGGLRRVHAV